MATVEIVVKAAQEGQVGAFQLEELVRTPAFAELGIHNPNTGTILSIQDGSVKSYLEKNLEKFGGPNAYVFLIFRFRYDDTEKMPTSSKARNYSPQDIARDIESGHLRLKGNITKEQLDILKKGKFPPGFSNVFDTQ